MLSTQILSKAVVTLALLLTFSFSLSAQILDHVQGQLLVQLNEKPGNQSVKSWFASQVDANGNSLNLKYQEEISKHVKIYLVTFDHAAEDENFLLSELRRNPQVTNAQFNHFVTTRSTVPDDPEFASQWQYINTGQSGGTSGADIDMDLAWDYTTGGITANGDTIVACIIDDGVNPNHPDMGPNLWINYAEIPGNGVDDDGNGYIDDYRGWDTGSNSDAVYDGGGHGTPVAGIVGARGNDGYGVAGVNWNVKLMIVQGGTGVESEVLEAYGYPLDARIRYNETDGAEGAFVVTTNASWGINFGDPNDSPLWCAFYDTLGVHGILNCGATINGNQNVDVVGDLPTACPSDYLIAVTNMNHNDVKVTGAGFGLETIDLGAFGQGTWTVTGSTGGFGGFGGTSGATPHVAGTVALLYSLPCSNLIDIAKSDPGAVALIMKQAIFDGVDQNTSLQGITTTGGRLNVHNAVLNVLEQCGGCLPPGAVVASVETDSQAVVSYNLLDTAVNTVNLRYRPIGSEEWINLADVMSPLTIGNLIGCTDYEFQLQSVCDTTMSDFGRFYEFSTLGCCENPETITVMALDSNSVSFNWSSVFLVESYELETRVAGTTDWTVTSTTETSALIEDLAACTELEYRFRVICSDTTSADYTDIRTVATFGCGACVDLTYCTTPDISVEDEWIGSVNIGDIDNDSDAGDSGYQDFTGGPTTTLVGGETYFFTLAPDFSGFNYNEGWAIFIDYNHDGSFTGTGERVWQSPFLTSSPVGGNFVVPITVTDGFTRLRVAMTYEAFPNACNSNGSDFGEYEDYCVSIEATVLPDCEAPQGLSQMDVDPANDSTATFSWLSSGEASEYQLRYENMAGDFVEVNTTDTFLVITELDSCATYDVQVRSLCFFDRESEFSEVVSLQTACISSLRFAQIGLDAWSIAPNPTTARVNVSYRFAQSPNQLATRLFNQFGQEVQYRNVNGTQAGNLNVDLSNLPTGVYYLRLETELGQSRVRKVVKF
jgi:subtilisin family serine protease